MTRRDASGFTLIETLVALVILSVTVVATLQLFAGGLRLVGASGDHVGATLLASAKLTEAEPGPIEAGVTEGSEGAYRWTRRVTLEPALVPSEAAGSAPATGPATTVTRVAVARISVEVSWGKSRRLEMVTLRSWSERS